MQSHGPQDGALAMQDAAVLRFIYFVVSAKMGTGLEDCSVSNMPETTHEPHQARRHQAGEEAEALRRRRPSEAARAMILPWWIYLLAMAVCAALLLGIIGGGA